VGTVRPSASRISGTTAQTRLALTCVESSLTGPILNGPAARIDFDAWSTNGVTHYWHIQGDTHTGCRINDGLYAFNDGTDDIPPNTQAIVCGTLYRAGNPQPKLLTRTCVYVG
jgi:hypothetical protein